MFDNYDIKFLFTSIIAKYLEVYSEKILGDYQCGFRKARSTTDHLFQLRQILEKTYEYDVVLHQLFIDFKQAYDSINRNQLLNVMEEFGIPSKLINLTKITLQKTNNQVQFNGRMSEKFETNNIIVITDKYIYLSVKSTSQVY